MAEQNKDNIPLTLADIAEPRTRDSTAGFAVWRALRTLWYFVLPRGMTRHVTIGGIRYRLTAREKVDRALLKRGYWERNQILFFFNEARRRGARVFLDVGASFGYYSLLAARLGIFDEIHAIEPHPETYRRLLWHIKANNFENVITPHNVAAGASAREMRMRANIAGRSDFQQVSEDSSLPDSIAIKSAPLDSLLALRGKNICAKIDVEGCEISALDGARELLANNRCFLQVEIWPGNSPDIAKIMSRGLSLVRHHGDDFYFANGEADN